MKNISKTSGLSKPNYLKNKIFNLVKNENPGVNTLKSLKAFTLVELIIVITILAILSTIGFVSFQSYTKTTRDSNRLATLRNMETGLNIYQAKNNLVPETSSGITIFGSGEIFGYQGTFGDNQANIIGMSKTPTDPQTGELYIYSTNQTKTKYQLLGFFENSDVVTYKVGNEVLAADNTLKIPKVFGNNLGVILDTNNESPTSNVYLTGTTNIKVILSNTNQISGTGIALSKAKSSFKYGKITWGYYDPNCDLDDVVIGNQVWAGCNSTLGSGMEWGQADSDIGTNNYNGTVSSSLGCYYDYDWNNVLVGNCAPLNINMRSNSNATTFFSGTNNNGDKEVNNIWGKFYTWTGAVQTACPLGRRVPSVDDWVQMERYLGCSDSILKTSSRCVGFGFIGKNNKSINNNIVNALKLPLSGNFFSNQYFGRGGRIYIWLSDTDKNDSTKAWMVSNFNYNIVNSINLSTISKINGGFSTRCIKN